MSDSSCASNATTGMPLSSAACRIESTACSSRAAMPIASGSLLSAACSWLACLSIWDSVSGPVKLTSIPPMSAAAAWAPLLTACQNGLFETFATSAMYRPSADASSVVSSGAAEEPQAESARSMAAAAATTRGVFLVIRTLTFRVVGPRAALLEDPYCGCERCLPGPPREAGLWGSSSPSGLSPVVESRPATSVMVGLAAAGDVDEDRDEHDDTEDDLLELVRDGQDLQAVVDGADDQGSDDGAEDVGSTAAQGRSPDDDCGDGVHLVPGAGRWLGRVEPSRHHDA